MSEESKVAEKVQAAAETGDDIIDALGDVARFLNEHRALVRMLFRISIVALPSLVGLVGAHYVSTGGLGGHIAKLEKYAERSEKREIALCTAAAQVAHAQICPTDDREGPVTVAPAPPPDRILTDSH